MTANRLRHLRLLVFLILTIPGYAVSAVDDVAFRLGEPLRDALDRYAQLGLNIVSSTRTLPRRLTVTHLPEDEAPLLDQIQSLLRPHGLTVVMVDENNGYVAQLHTQEPSEPSVGDADAADSGAIEEVVVTSHYRVRRQRNTPHRVDHQDLLTAPSLGRDVLRGLDALPGVASSGISARHQFRGGDVNEVLYRLDGVELLEPFHLPTIYDLFSAINMNIVEAADVYVAGFPVSLGSRMSGVVDLELTEPSRPLAGHVDINLINAAADVSGWRGNWSWLASGRRSVVDKTLQQLETDYGTPRFHDEFLRLSHDTESHSASLNLLNSRDRTTVFDTGEEGQSNNDYQAIWFNWQQDFTPTLSTNWSVQHVAIENKRIGSVDIPDFSTGNLTEDQKFATTELANHWQWQAAADYTVTAGWSVAYQRAEFTAEFNADYGSLALPIQQQPSVARSIDIDRSGESMQAYLSLTSAITDKLVLETGVRYDGQDIDPVHVNELSARVNLTWQATPSWRFAVNAGRYTQQQHLYEIQIDDGKAELEDPQHSDQVNMTTVWAPDDRIRFRVDLYHRRIDNAWSHFENLYNRWVLFPELQGDRFEVAPSRVTSQGLEATFTHTPNDAWTWFAYYGFALAEEKYLGKQRNRPWAQRHSGKAGIRWQHPRWRVGLNLHYRSGWATTSVIRNPLQLPSEVFESELPAYFTLDAHVSRIIRAPRGEVEVYLDVMNLTNRDNVGGYDYTTFDDRDAQNLLPLTPVLGVLWRW